MIIRIFTLILFFIGNSSIALCQDKGLYSIIELETSIMPFKIRDNSIAFTHVNVNSNSKLIYSPSISYGIGYCFNDILVEFSVHGNYIKAEQKISLIETYTPAGFLAESRERSIVLDQINLTPRLTVSSNIISNISIRSSFEVPIKVIDKTRINYNNNTYWSNLSITGDSEYFPLIEPNEFSDSIEEVSGWGNNFHGIISLGLEWRAFNWDFGYVTHERPRTLSFYVTYSAHLTNNTSIIQGTEFGNFLTLGTKLSF